MRIFAIPHAAGFGRHYLRGRRATLNDVKDENMQTNARVSRKFVMPADRSNSGKIYAGTGASNRTGVYANSVGIAWQYRWGGGF